MQRSLLTKSSVCCINHTSNPSFRKHTKCASTNFLHLSSSAPNSPIHWSLGSFVSGHAQQIFFFFGCCCFSSSFFFLPQNIVYSSYHNQSHAQLWRFVSFFRNFFFLSPPLVVQKFHRRSMMMKKRTTKTRTKKVLLFHHKSKNPVKKKWVKKKISVCRHLSFPIPISLFPFRVVVKSNTLVLCSLHSTKISQ